MPNVGVTAKSRGRPRGRVVAQARAPIVTLARARAPSATGGRGKNA